MAASPQVSIPLREDDPSPGGGSGEEPSEGGFDCSDLTITEGVPDYCYEDGDGYEYDYE